MDSFTLTVDGISRTVYYRDPGTSPKDAVISLHPRGSSGSTFLTQKVDPSDERIDFAPNALVQDESKTRWVIPGDSGLPWYNSTNTPNDGTDLKLVNDLISHIQANYSSVTRIWVWGYSSGGKLTLTCYAFRGDSAYPKLADLQGYGASSWGEPVSTAFNWLTKADAASPKPIAMWYGTLDPTDPTTLGEDWVNYPTLASAMNTLWDDMKDANDCSGQASQENLGTCGGGLTLQRRKATGCGSGGMSWRYNHVGGQHSWANFTNCKTTVRFEELFALFGYGT